MTDDITPSTSGPGVPDPQRSAATGAPARLRELSPKTMWLTAAVIAVLTAGAVVVLWWPATAGLNGADLVSARLDALKVGLSVAVGSGGVVALYLAWRRQHSTEADLDNRERTLAHQQHDATERRLTELYLKAVEQLGSAQAAVRHGGLYALERVAQDNPSQRQTVVNVICAYLRNFYTPPSATGEPRSLGVRRPLLRSTTTPRPPTPHANSPAREAQLHEREVRLTAQGILKRHLNPGEDPGGPQPTFWPEIDIDLTGATLIDFSLFRCNVAEGCFGNATFVGEAEAVFRGATFTGDTVFSGATFTGDAGFGGATFTGDSVFSGATFTGDAGFGRATFTRGSTFAGASFADDTSFSEATFNGSAVFNAATFAGRAGFDGATFDAAVGFVDAAFDGVVGFRGATRNGHSFDPTTHDASPPDEAALDSEEGAS
ncbi:pentapeptide repeat-containing protein [Amycolatopsis sp. NPDC049252]|uniref:pentapeptide repeat-containing protein n=1 Tax=Amycolatopsis sp. NPDC049252 TaxID=3363933 RepID=UPI0037158249